MLKRALDNRVPCRNPADISFKSSWDALITYFTFYRSNPSEQHQHVSQGQVASSWSQLGQASWLASHLLAQSQGQQAAVSRSQQVQAAGWDSMTHELTLWIRNPKVINTIINNIYQTIWKILLDLVFFLTFWFFPDFFLTFSCL